MTARVAPFFPTAYTADGVLKTFALGFPIIRAEDVRVISNGVLKVLGTDYAIVEATSRAPSVRFFAAPTNTYALKFYRNTSIGLPVLNPEVSHVEARVAKYRQEERDDARREVKYYFNQTDLLAPTAQSFVAPVDGYIEKLWATVEKAVTTGGVITVEIDGVAVTGLSITVADADAAGTVYSDTPTTAQSATTKVSKGQTITVTPGAPFATAGVVSGYLEIQPADLT